MKKDEKLRKRKTVTEEGTWSGAQIRAVEAHGWRVKKISRWAMIHARRGCGERVIESIDATLKATDRRAEVLGGTG